tara:strand:- start:172 stop:1506 length:1335 start_codon:yes stop_codon:yes gene_type:complete
MELDMTRQAATIKKHLSFDSLQKTVSTHLLNIEDSRIQGRCNHSLHDAVMSGFACMFFQEPSMSEFQRRMEMDRQQNNLRSIFNVETIPKESQLRDIIDSVSSENLRPIFKDFFTRLQRGKYLQEFQILPGHYICAIDGVYHHSSENIHCEKCLTKTHKNGTVTYSHGVLQGAFMHPDKKQVIPVMPEPIANSDGSKKQDCEINAAKRFIKKLKKDHPRLDIVITGDGLFSKSPMVNLTRSEGMHFLFVAKPDDHKYMMEWLDAFACLPEVISIDIKGRTHQYQYMNNVPLNGRDDASLVNYIYYRISDKNGKVIFKNSWVTDIEVTDLNVSKLAKGGRCRWKIENECFNTLKNQGYMLNHNFGHGKNNLSHNMYLLTLLAFFFHQIFELSDPAYQACRKSFVAKKSLWEAFRWLVSYFIFADWNDLMLKAMDGRGGISSLSKN